MKRFAAAMLAAVLLLAFTGCSRYPQTDLTGQAWDREWEMLGTVLGVEEPTNGFTLSQNTSILTGDDTYYATWTTGEPKKWTNEDGDEVDLYPAQIYLLLYGCGDEAAAQDAMADFISREEEKYTVRETVAETHGGEPYTILLYDCGSDTNPYSHGVSAFGLYKNYVINAELSCTADFDGDDRAVLAAFLDGCHLAALTE